MHVFTYGSLMFPEVWRLVVHGEYRSCAAQVSGFVRRRVRDEAYPGMIRGPHHNVVAGRVYFDVSTIDLARLDRFEGDYYHREPVAVALDEGGHAQAALYLFKDEYKGLLEQRDWDVAWFEREGLARFLGGYKGFGRR